MSSRVATASALGDILAEVGGIRTPDDAKALFERTCDAETLDKLASITHSEALLKIANAIALCQPDDVFITTGSPEDMAAIRKKSIEKGEEAPLAMKDHTIHYDLAEEQGRIVDRTFYIVNEAEQVVITQFGKPVGDPVTTPGLKFKTPFLQKANYFDKRFLEWDGDPNQLPTRDKRFIWVNTYARWRITDPLLFFQRLRDELGAQTRLDDILDGETRNTVANYDLIEVVRSTNREFVVSSAMDESAHREITAGRVALEKEVLDNASMRVEVLGIEILDFRFKRLNYVSEVQNEVFELRVPITDEVSPPSVTQNTRSPRRMPWSASWRRPTSVRSSKPSSEETSAPIEEMRVAATRNAEEIREALAARDPANTQWQRDLSVSHDNIGNVLVAQGDGPAAHVDRVVRQLHLAHERHGDRGERLVDLPQIDLLRPQAGLGNPHFQQVEPVFALAAADDFADAGNQHVHRRDCLAVVADPHVKGFDRPRVIEKDHGRLAMIFGEKPLVF